MTDAAVPTELPDVDPDRTVDNRGRGCANGIAAVQRALEDLPDGAVLEIRSTDKRAKQEYPKLAAQTPHELLGIESERTGLLTTVYTTYLRVREG
ncbi:sulfurtransferase TusA family protein [Natrinema thermotolerans]|uniref:Sulfurtransferase TusA family protein n=1 Tax=Natrinema thermotolerans TaxID=121872 RepID=A0AAF0PD68_9EURY|nr:sulfurtransferase TusA family protein [Natrinema thermotolerans]ELZ12931.1 SirA family protein [Natrinema thermotolerans DSM 11552]QCC57955.1 sulfurtransferase TusA family protein [Natrinema thermotolerans]WMT09051.1 sulfurtransferase TusA family protein [Natrinema thermotolerans]